MPWVNKYAFSARHMALENITTKLKDKLPISKDKFSHSYHCVSEMYKKVSDLLRMCSEESIVRKGVPALLFKASSR